MKMYPLYSNPFLEQRVHYTSRIGYVCDSSGPYVNINSLFGWENHVQSCSTKRFSTLSDFQECILPWNEISANCISRNPRNDPCNFRLMRRCQRELLNWSHLNPYKRKMDTSLKMDILATSFHRKLATFISSSNSIIFACFCVDFFIGCDKAGLDE